MAERTVIFDDEKWQLVPRNPTPEMLGAALSVTSGWLNLTGSKMTVNYKKMSMRYRAMLSTASRPYDGPLTWDQEYELALAERAAVYPNDAADVINHQAQSGSLTVKPTVMNGSNAGSSPAPTTNHGGCHGPSPLAATVTTGHPASRRSEP